KWTVRQMGLFLDVSHVYLIQMEKGRKPLNSRALQLINEKNE
ncbi:unnamed protein product, partial [marine sediment metagenome]